MDDTLFFRRLLGWLLGIVARVWLSTLRVTVLTHEALDASDPRPWILAFFHGEQFALLAWRRRRKTVALVSLSKDGELQSRALRVVGMRVERGSTSRGGARGLAAIVRRLRKGEDAAFAVDGPKGPRFHVHEGALLAARASSGLVIPMASRAERGLVLQKTWDQYVLPAPFSRVVVALGEPLSPQATPSMLGDAIRGAGAMAEKHLAMLGSAPLCATSSHSARAKFPST